MNRPIPIHRLSSRLAHFGLVACFSPLACSGKVLSFTPSETTSTAAIAEVTDDEADQLCAWLTSNFPGDVPDSTAIPGFPGFLSGPGLGCTDPPLMWFALAPQSACVANLRHSACQASVASLQQCAEYFHAHSRDMVCSDAWAACTAFVSAANCDQTVFQTISPDGGSGSCAALLPVEPDAVCPGTDGLDGGADQ